ncbi:HeH/LEM domain-containing protein [Enterococcus innesii]
MAAVDYNSLTVAQLKALLDERGVDYPSNALKADLITLAEE